MISPYQATPVRPALGSQRGSDSSTSTSTSCPSSPASIFSDASGHSSFTTDTELPDYQTLVLKGKEAISDSPPIFLDHRNAREFFRSRFDLAEVQRELERAEPPLRRMSEEEFLELLVAHTRESNDIRFWEVEDRHLEKVQLKRGTLGLSDQRRAELVKLGYKAVQPLEEWLDLMKTFWMDSPPPHRTPGKFITSVLVPAIDAAQATYESRHMSDTHSDTEFIVVQPNFDLEMTSVTGGVEADGLRFGGSIDWIVALASESQRADLRRGRPPELDPSHVLLAIEEAKTEEAFSTGSQRIIASVIAGLKATGRNTFAGVLTNGLRWDLYLAIEINNRICVYSGLSLQIKIAEERALLVGVLATLLSSLQGLPEGVCLVDELEQEG